VKRVDRRFLSTALVLVMLIVSGLAYTPRPLPELSPGDCPAMQHSQGVTIGALPYVGQDAIRTLFDTKDLYKTGVVPILLVIHNENPFAVSMGARGAAVIDSLGQRNPSIPYPNVVAALLQRRDVRAISSGPVVDLSALKSGKTADLIEDFRNKSMDMERIPPAETVRKVVFFRMGTDPAALDSALLYFGEIYNEDTAEELIFFEFELKLPPVKE
jgi:hypothetical protein